MDALGVESDAAVVGTLLLLLLLLVLEIAAILGRCGLHKRRVVWCDGCSGVSKDEEHGAEPREIEQMFVLKSTVSNGKVIFIRNFMMTKKEMKQHYRIW